MNGQGKSAVLCYVEKKKSQKGVEGSLRGKCISSLQYTKCKNEDCKHVTQAGQTNFWEKRGKAESRRLAGEKINHVRRGG